MIAEAFYEAMQAVTHLWKGELPLPAGLTTVETDDWTLAVNNGREPVPWEGSELPGYNVGAMHKVYFAMSLLDANGGVIGGGMSEDEFIADMKAIQQVPA